MLLCHIPDYCYHQQELPKLTCLIGNNSASFLYSHRRILIELEYIQIRQSGSLRNRLTEYRLVPLYDVGTSNNSQNDEEIYADEEIPQHEGVPADGSNTERIAERITERITEHLLIPKMTLFRLVFRHKERITEHITERITEHLQPLSPCAPRLPRRLRIR